MNQAQIYAGGAPGVYPQQGSVVGGGRNGHSRGTEADDDRAKNDEKDNGRYTFALQCAISQEVSARLGSKRDRLIC